MDFLEKGNRINFTGEMEFGEWKTRMEELGGKREVLEEGIHEETARAFKA